MDEIVRKDRTKGMRVNNVKYIYISGSIRARAITFSTYCTYVTSCRCLTSIKIKMFNLQMK